MKSPSLKNKINQLPTAVGVYLFRDKPGKILYIGKATNLRQRVSSYFSGSSTSVKTTADKHDPRIARMIAQINRIDYQKTDSVLEALILEANLVKKFQPKYNIKLKDDKSFCYFIITKEKFPKVMIVRKTDIGEVSFPRKRESRKHLSGSRISARGGSVSGRKSGMTNKKLKRIYGPYTSRKQMEIALNIMRKIFPFHSLAQQTEKNCLDFHLGRCPGPYNGTISPKDYLKNIRGIQMILEGKKNNLIKKLEKEMADYSRDQQFEKAAELRNKIFALKHIQDIALISFGDDNFQFPIFNFQTNYEKNIPHRIEAYDISNIFGQLATGSMIVFTDGQIDKSEYRKFKIKNIRGIDDVAMIKEVLQRRLQHQEWPIPDLIFIDGGAGQFNGAIKSLQEAGLKIPVVALAKGPTRRGEKLFSSVPISIHINLLKEIRDEAHRFAISYHRLLRKKKLTE